MHSGIGSLLRFIGRNLLSLVAIACILALGNVALKEWHAVRAAQSNLVTLESGETAASAHAQQATLGLGERIVSYRNAPLGALETHIATLEAREREAALVPLRPLLRFPLPSGGDLPFMLAQQYKQKVDLEILRQELACLRQLHAYATAGLNKPGALDRLRLLHAAHVDAYDRYLVHARTIADLNWIQRALLEQPGMRSAYLASLANERARLLAENNSAWQAWNAQHVALARIDSALSAAAPGLDAQRIDAMLAPLRDDVGRASAVVSGSVITHALGPVIDALPLAAFVLLMSCAGHLLVKALFYYVLAPLAATRKPIRLDHKYSGSIVSDTGVPTSAVSQQVLLAAGERLLVLPDYVQSAPVGGEKKTRWLLDWSCPWTSLVSGMFALTSISTTRSEPVILSASDDASSELALVTLPAGASMVFQPRCLVGVLYADATPLRISRHWRLGTLHAWLTLQLRYLVFHGPATLVVKGSRGVRVEAAGPGRLISQAATLGFSANLEYSTVRCDTFFPFYLGKTALLQDQFAGGPGYYVYDETPRGGKRGNAVARGLEGLTDALFKVFGI